MLFLRRLRFVIVAFVVVLFCGFYPSTSPHWMFPTFHVHPRKFLVHAHWRSITQHCHHSARGQPVLRPSRFYLIISAFKIRIAHDRVPLCLSNSNRPIRVFPTSGDQHQLLDKLWETRREFQRQHRAHRSSYAHGQFRHFQSVQHHLLQVHVISYRHRRGKSTPVNLPGRFWIFRNRRSRSVRRSEVVATDNKI